MKLTGITGGIGAGKSVVSRVLRTQGFAVYDCDLEARRLMQASRSIRESLCGKFGAECIGAEGILDRRYIASKVFGNSEHLKWLNKLVHAEVRADVCEWARRNFAGEGPAKWKPLFVESAILVSSGLAEMCGCIWHVDAPESLRVERAMNRGGISRDDISARIEAQRNEFDFLPSGKTLRIDNSGETSLLDEISRALSETEKILQTNNF